MNNNQRKETFSEVKQRITRDEFVSKLTELGREETIKFFGLGLTNFGSLVHFYECERILEDWKQKKRREAYEKKAKEKFDTLLQDAPKELFIDYYITQNNSLLNTAKHFKITEGQCLQLVNYYDCRKPKTLSTKISSETKQEKYGDANYNNREQASQTCFEKYNVSNPAKVSFFIDKATSTKVCRYGKENSNPQLMIDNGFVEVVDSGQNQLHIGE